MLSAGSVQFWGKRTPLKFAGAIHANEEYSDVLPWEMIVVAALSD